MAEAMNLVPYDLRMEVKFSEEPVDIDWSDEASASRTRLAGFGEFLWQRGTSLDDPASDVLIRASDETPFYPVREPPYYIDREVALDRLNYLRKRYKCPPLYVRVEMAYLEDMVKKRKALVDALGLGGKDEDSSGAG